MCFVWIWEQTAIISLYSINWLVFTTERERVYCAVRKRHLYIIQDNLNPHISVIAQAVTRRSPTAEAHVGSQSMWYFCWTKKHFVILSCDYFLFPPVSIIPPTLPCQYHSTHSPLSVSFHQCSTLIFIYMFLLPEGKLGEVWKISKKQRFCGHSKAMDRKLLSCSLYMARRRSPGCFE